MAHKRPLLSRTKEPIKSTLTAEQYAALHAFARESGQTVAAVVRAAVVVWLGTLPKKRGK